jgi:hypothetical protein
MDAKHTPGPLTITQRDKREAYCDPGLWITDAQGNTVVDTGNLKTWSLAPHHKALLEAAPDLLAFAHNVAEAVDTNGAETNLDNILAAARAAIAKAEGRS